MLKLYENIKVLRQLRGFTQEELALKVDYTNRTTIAKIEAGEVDLSQSKIKAFAKALGVTPAYLMGWDTVELTEDGLEEAKKKIEAITEKTKNGFYFWLDVQERNPKVLSFRIFALSHDEETMILSGGHPTFLHIQKEGQMPVGFSDPRLQKELYALRRAINEQIDNRAKPLTIAAHATEDLNEEDIEEIYKFIDFIKSKKK